MTPLKPRAFIIIYLIIKKNKKMKHLKILIGTTAVLAVTALNLRHAWNDYGFLKKDAIQKVWAQEDGTTCIVDGTVFCNTKTIPITYFTNCIVKQTTYYRLKLNKSVLVATEEFDLKTNQSTIKYGIGFSEKHIVLCDRDVVPIINTFEDTQIDCSGYEQDASCVHKKAVTDCKIFVGGSAT